MTNDKFKDIETQEIDQAIQREELAMAESLQMFRSVVHHVAERESFGVERQRLQWGSFRQRLRLMPGWAFAWGLMAALCLSVLPLWMHSRHEASPGMTTPMEIGKKRKAK